MGGGEGSQAIGILLFLRADPHIAAGVRYEHMRPVRERIEAGIYGADEAVTPNALEAIASRLRKRLSDAGADGMLHTVRGVGYYLGNGSD